MGKIVHIFIVFSLFQATILAQIPGLTQFTANNGLPSNTIYDIVQDENGFIWFATDYGISKFDGLTFKNYTVTDGLPGNEILSFYKDSKNRIWMTAFNGNVGFIQNGHFYNKDNLTFLSKLQFTIFIDDIYEDSKGKIWLCQNADNIKVLNTDLSIKNYSAITGIKLMFTSLIIEDTHQKVHLLTYLKVDNRISVITKLISEKSNLLAWEEFNPNQFPNTSIEKINNTFGMLLREKNEIIKKISKYLIQEKNSFLVRTYLIGKNYWITNLNNGVYIFNEEDNYKNPKIILKNTQSTRAYIDSENNIWIGSQSNGIFLFPNLKIQGIKFEDPNKNDLYSVGLYQDKLVLGNEQNEVAILNRETLQTIKILKLDENPKRIKQLKSHNDLLFILGFL